MKRSFSLAITGALFLLGCGDKPSTQSGNSGGTSSGNPVTAPVDYLQAAGNAKNRAVATVDVTSVNQAIQMFNVQEGRNPKDLNELVETKFLTRIPDAPYNMKIEYDAAAGKVKVVPK
jgi:hypothetical protein